MTVAVMVVMMVSMAVTTVDYDDFSNHVRLLCDR
jgi:hypothetical protein